MKMKKIVGKSYSHYLDLQLMKFCKVGAILIVLYETALYFDLLVTKTISFGIIFGGLLVVPSVAFYKYLNQDENPDLWGF